MKLSKSFFRTLREVPNEAEIPSHILLLRAGMIKKTAAGIYSYMPMGYRTIKKIENIVREEMDAKGAQEISVHRGAGVQKDLGMGDRIRPELPREHPVPHRRPRKPVIVQLEAGFQEFGESRHRSSQSRVLDLTGGALGGFSWFVLLVGHGATLLQ